MDPASNLPATASPAPSGPVAPAQEISRGPAPEPKTIELTGALLPAAPCNAFLNRAEIDQKMAQEGIPELKRHWRYALAKGLTTEEQTDEKISLARSRHMAPLGSYPMTTAVVITSLSGVLTSLFCQAFNDQFPALVRPIFAAATFFNLGFLATYTATMLQRYLAQPLEKVMASDVAFMLKQKSFRAWFEQTSHAQLVKNELAALQVTGDWDNPAYKNAYHQSAGRWQKTEVPNHSEFVRAALREFLGYKDPEKRKFIEGKHIRFLKDGKRSVTAFVNSYGEMLQLNASGQLPPETATRLLELLLTEHVVPESEGALMLAGCIKRAREQDYLSTGAVQAQVWQRDPWVDLTHQEEFYSSASLRGVKLMGRGPKGRLGTFGYLRNKAISALDFSLKKKRVVRARLGAAAAKDLNGATRAVLFVDGVEGSNAIKPKVIQAAIEDYARRCNFDAVCYNHFVHNQIPRRFVQHLGAEGLPVKQLKISYVGAAQREYLDAFGLPLEPFEYSFPDADVMAHVVALKPDVTLATREPSLSFRAWCTLKRNTLWLLVGETTAYATGMIALNAPGFLVPFFAATGLGVYAHLRYQKKSLKAFEASQSA